MIERWTWDEFLIVYCDEIMFNFDEHYHTKDVFDEGFEILDHVGDWDVYRLEPPMLFYYSLVLDGYLPGEIKDYFIEYNLPCVVYEKVVYSNYRLLVTPVYYPMHEYLHVLDELGIEEYNDLLCCTFV
ncbi:MAG: hypothetical protein BZ136_09295 [Methanosphaera sp. rholeuAM74]|nr:MAG: hypothetical protein BZ136_09295 [Methanosphaera sp. rholeuAM74]